MAGVRLPAADDDQRALPVDRAARAHLDVFVYISLSLSLSLSLYTCIYIYIYIYT